MAEEDKYIREAREFKKAKGMKRHVVSSSIGNRNSSGVIKTPMGAMAPSAATKAGSACINKALENYSKGNPLKYGSLFGMKPKRKVEVNKLEKSSTAELLDTEALKKAKTMAEKAEPLYKPISSSTKTSMLEAEKISRSADKAWKAGRILKKMTKAGKIGKALGLGAAAFQVYENWDKN